MADEFKEITTTSWGKRIVDSLKGIILGVGFFIASFYLIFWNEGRSVDRIKTLDEGRNLLIAVSSGQIDANNNGKLVHISDNAITSDILKDDFFGVQENALKLKRTVEMYQWKENENSETKKDLGGSETKETTYSYEKIWSEKPINSGNFKKREGHENPTMPYNSKTYSANDITIGAFKLTEPFIKKIKKFEEYPLSQKNFDAMDSRLKPLFTLVGNKYFYGDANNPQIGALRISYGIIKPTEISVIGKQDNNTIQIYYTKRGDINLLEMGNVSAESMFSHAKSENTLITWLVRLGAFILMWAGLAMILTPIRVLGDVVPFIGNVLGAGIGLLSGIISLVLSFSTMAIAWIFYRPIVGIILLILVVGFLFGGLKIIKNKLQKEKAN
jgi:hypothetical protein